MRQKQWRVGTTNSNLYALFCTVVKSATTPPSNMGSHRQIWRSKTCACPGQVRRVEKERRRRERHRRQTLRHQNNWLVMPAAPAVNTSTSCLARPRVAPAIRKAATACPVGVCCGAPMSFPIPNRTSSERRRGGHWEERGSGKGRGGVGAERGGHNRARAEGTGTGQENSTRQSNAPPLPPRTGTSEKERKLVDNATQ